MINQNIYIDIKKENNYRTTQTTKSPKTHNLAFHSPTRIMQLCPASYMLLQKYILYFYNTEKIERKIKQAKQNNNRYPVTYKN